MSVWLDRRAEEQWKGTGLFQRGKRDEKREGGGGKEREREWFTTREASDFFLLLFSFLLSLLTLVKKPDRGEARSVTRAAYRAERTTRTPTTTHARIECRAQLRRSAVGEGLLPPPALLHHR